MTPPADPPGGERSHLPGLPPLLRRQRRGRIGDLPGLISRLDYLAELGIDAIWVSPFYPSPLNDGGYDVSDYREWTPGWARWTTSGPRWSNAIGAGSAS
jgi:glycosidase